MQNFETKILVPRESFGILGARISEHTYITLQVCQEPRPCRSSVATPVHLQLYRSGVRSLPSLPVLRLVLPSPPFALLVRQAPGVERSLAAGPRGHRAVLEHLSVYRVEQRHAACMPRGYYCWTEC